MFIILLNDSFAQNLIQIKEWEALWIYQSIDAGMKNSVRYR